MFSTNMPNLKLLPHKLLVALKGFISKKVIEVRITDTVTTEAKETSPALQHQLVFDQIT